MFPLRDSHYHPTHRFPLITYLIIALNAYVFFLEFTSFNPDSFIFQYSLIPARVNWSDVSTLYPFITSQFLHAGIVHIISNMWFLKIFGDNVEERFGSLKFLAIYLLSGIVGGLLQYFFSPNSQLPMLGASGAVAGILGSYFVFFPRHKIQTLVPIGILTVIDVPASVMLIYWFVTQIFSGVGSVALAQVGGVAWWAHVGGFVTGWIFAQLSKDSKSEFVEELSET